MALSDGQKMGAINRNKEIEEEGMMIRVDSGMPIEPTRKSLEFNNLNEVTM